VILIDIWEGSDPRPEVERFCEMWGIEGTILLDETADYARSLGVRGVPTNILVDADGIVRDVGLVRIDELHSAVDALLAD
jgi:redoxin